MSTCPRDGTPLQSSPNLFGPNTTAQRCPKCAGVQVEWKVAKSFFESLGLTLADLQTSVKHAQAVTRPGAEPPTLCTACGKANLALFRVKGVELDLCEQCGSCWFDRGELNRVSGGKLGGALPTAPQAIAGERVETVGVYEMWWDCGFCSTTALLGQSNRYCPKCGAPQDPARRYFPPAGQETAANREYDGADKACPACQMPNGAKAVHCRQCGSPMDGSVEVARVADRVARPVQPNLASRAPSKPGRLKWVLGALAVMLLGFCGVAVLWKKEVTAQVTGHSWSRQIDVEVMKPKSDSAWCDTMPSDAYGVSRHREQRSTRQIPDGETCSTRDVDRGNGSFERRRECKPKYRSEPVYDDRCSFTVDRWQVERTLRTDGRGLEAAPTWPAVSLSRTGSSIGSEREGSHREKYVVELKGAKGESWTCDLPAQRWSGVPDGVERKIKVGVITNSADCDTL